ncbi:MAG: C40 family peptidase [Bacteroidota bacterium]
MNRGRTYYLRIISLGAICITTWSCTAEQKVRKYDYLITHQRPRTNTSTYNKPAPYGESFSSTSTSSVKPSESAYTPYTHQQNGSLSAEVKPFDHNELFPDENYTATLDAESANALNEVVHTAKSYLGTPYVYGGMSGNGMDCSGLICLSYQSVGIRLPRTSRDMAARSKKIPKRKVKKGDLLFFSAKNTGRVDHVGLVTAVKGGTISFIHATSSRGVRVDVLSDDYWSKRFQFAGRP